jgi:hypothetical protein
MKLQSCSYLDPSALVNALLINPHGAEYRVVQVVISLPDLMPMLLIQGSSCLDSPCAIAFEQLTEWQIQLDPLNY